MFFKQMLLVYQWIKILLGFHHYLATALQIHYTIVSFAPRLNLQAGQPLIPEKSNLLPKLIFLLKHFMILENNFYHEDFIKQQENWVYKSI